MSCTKCIRSKENFENTTYDTDVWYDGLRTRRNPKKTWEHHPLLIIVSCFLLKHNLYWNHILIPYNGVFNVNYQNW